MKMINQWETFSKFFTYLKNASIVVTRRLSLFRFITVNVGKFL